MLPKSPDSDPEVKRLLAASGEVVEELPRLLGRAAASCGVGSDVLLGLLDGGLTLDDVIELLVMHGELPTTLERSEAPTFLRLEESPEGGWRVAS